MKKHAFRFRTMVAVLACSLSWGGCSGSDPGMGGVELHLAALNADDVASATVTVTGPGIDPPVVIQLVRSDNEWVGDSSTIPAGVDRTFTLVVLDANDVEIYRGQVTGVTIAAGETAAVAIGGQQSTPSPVFENSVPVLDSVVAHSVSVSPGDAVTLIATAHDPDEGDTLTYSWTATNGSFSSPSTATTNWQSTTVPGTYRITVTVSDAAGATASIWVDVTVTPGIGESSITVDINSWPEVTALTSTASRIDVGDTTLLAVTATEPDGDALAYSWSTDCAGTFSATDVATPSFTLAALPAAGTCQFTVTVDDGRGGTASGTLTLTAAPPLQVNVAPQITSATASPSVTTPGSTVLLNVQAVDPEGTALTFTWETSIGTLATPTSDATSSEVLWTAPADFSTTAHITVTVTDAANATTVQTLYVAPLAE